MYSQEYMDINYKKGAHVIIRYACEKWLPCEDHVSTIW